MSHTAAADAVGENTAPLLLLLLTAVGVISMCCSAADHDLHKTLPSGDQHSELLTSTAYAVAHIVQDAALHSWILLGRS